MVTNGVAAAFCDPWKYQIERIKEGAVVFLYENGVGIVGTGVAPREVEKVEYDGVAEDAYRKKLIGYRKVKPLNAREIKKVIGRQPNLFADSVQGARRVRPEDSREYARSIGASGATKERSKSRGIPRGSCFVPEAS